MFFFLFILFIWIKFAFTCLLLPTISFKFIPLIRFIWELLTIIATSNCAKRIVFHVNRDFWICSVASCHITLHTKRERDRWVVDDSDGRRKGIRTYSKGCGRAASRKEEGGIVGTQIGVRREEPEDRRRGVPQWLVSRSCVWIKRRLYSSGVSAGSATEVPLLCPNTAKS